MKLIHIALIVPLIGAALRADAAAENLLLDEIVVRGRREKPNQESLTIREVKESPARDMGEALKQVEGVSIVRKGAIANDVVLRGFQKDNINVLLDGVRLHGACPNRMDSPAFHYDFAQIEQVEIVKGPYDLSNPGSMGGMVNAVTRKPEQGAGADLNITYGAYKSVNGSATASYGTEKYDALGGYAYKYSKVPEAGNGKRITDIYPATSGNRYRVENLNTTAYKINTYWGRAGFKPTDNSYSDISYSYQDAGHILYPYLLMDANFDKTSIVNWTYRVAEFHPVLKSLKFQVYWDRVEHVMDDSLRESSQPAAKVTRGYSMRSEAETRTGGAKAQAELAVGGGIMRGGADIYSRAWNVVNRRAMSSVYAPINMIPDADIVNTGIFAEYERALSGKVTLEGGVRGDIARARTGSANAVAADGDGRSFREGGGNLQLTVKPTEGLELFGGLARGVRLPDQKELFISIPNIAGSAKNTSGNPDLSATINKQADLGAKYSAESFYVRASVFSSMLKNYINLRGYQSGGVQYLTYENVNAAMWGGELGTQVSLPHDLFAKGGLSYARGRNTGDNRGLSEIPPLKGTAALRYDNGIWFLEAAENLSARQGRVDTALQETQTSSWQTTDLKAGYAYKNLSIYAGINNLFDKYYFSYLSYLRDPFASGMKVPENGRNLYVTLTYRL